MTVPEAIEKQAITPDEENNRVVIQCPKCSEYESEVDADDYDEIEDVFNQARRMMGSHWSAKHEDDKDGGGGGQTPSQEPSKGNNPSPPAQGGSQPQQPPQPQNQPQQSEQGGGDYGGGVNERELIYRKGKEGLLELKTERLKDWLQEANGVGGQTESRIIKVFQRNESVNTNPYSLYNLLEDETTASGSYINTMVDDIFEPEREHEDILESTGYTPFFRRSQGGGQFANQQQGGPSRGGGRGGGQQYGQSAAQGRGGRQQGQPQQNHQQQSNDSSDDLSKREVAQMISQGINTAQEEADENPLRDGLSDATDEALREMASNVGGLAGTANRVFEEALMSYAQDNPEFIIENMDFLQKALGAAQGPDEGGGGGQPQQPESSRKVDDALSQIGDGGQPQQQQNLEPDIPQQTRQQNQQPQQPQQNQTRQQTQQPAQNQQPTQSQPPQQAEPEPQTDANVGHDVGPEDSGFDPGAEDESNMTGQHPPIEEEEPPQEAPTPGEDINDEPQQKKQSEQEDDGFDEIFGDMAD